MSALSASKRLTYIVNYLSVDDSQHFVHIPNLLRELETLGWSIDLVSERGGRGCARIFGLDVTYLSRTSKVQRAVNLIRHLFRMRRAGGQLVFIRISKWAALLSAVLGRMFGWKTVFWVSGTVEDFNLRSGLKGRLHFFVTWALLRLVNRLATGPERMVEYYHNAYNLPTRKILLLYNDIDLRDRVSSRSVANTDDLRVLMVHRLSPVRETDRYFPAIIGALENHSSLRGSRITLEICGDGPERTLLESQAAECAVKTNVHFRGAVPQRHLSETYQRATVFIMPSFREGFPRVVIEAMAHGLPIVATASGGTRDILGQDQQAFVVDRDNATCFGEALTDLLDAPDIRLRLAAENLERVERFSTREVAKMYDLGLSKVIAAGGTD